MLENASKTQISSEIRTFQGITETDLIHAEIEMLHKELDRLIEIRTIELQLANQRIIDMLESMSDCFFSLDEQLCFSYINCQTERSINLTRDQILGKCILDIYPTETPNEWQVAYEKVLREKEPFCGELFDSFSKRWYRVSIYPSHEGGILGYFSDITEHKQT